jgi:hypothetical protein
MKLDFYCGCYKQWVGFFSEPTECEAEGTIEVDNEDWEENFVCMKCPECGAMLHQSDDHFTISSINTALKPTTTTEPKQDTKCSSSIQSLYKENG